MLIPLITASLAFAQPIVAATAPHNDAAAQAHNLRQSPVKKLKSRADRAQPAPRSEPESPVVVVTPTSAPTTWSEVPDQTRFLIIMGTIDGLSAAVINKPGSPTVCFNGKTNADIDRLLTENGYIGTGNGIGAALQAQATPGASCDPVARGYETKMMQAMKDSDLANYVGSAATAYLTASDCAQQPAMLAEAAARALLEPDANSASVSVMARAFAGLCLGDSSRNEIKSNPSGVESYGMSTPPQ